MREEEERGGRERERERKRERGREGGRESEREREGKRERGRGRGRDEAGGISGGEESRHGVISNSGVEAWLSLNCAVRLCVRASGD